MSNKITNYFNFKYEQFLYWLDERVNSLLEKNKAKKFPHLVEQYSKYIDAHYAHMKEYLEKNKHRPFKTPKVPDEFKNKIKTHQNLSFKFNLPSREKAAEAKKVNLENFEKHTRTGKIFEIVFGSLKDLTASDLENHLPSLEKELASLFKQAKDLKTLQDYYSDLSFKNRLVHKIKDILLKPDSEIGLIDYSAELQKISDLINSLKQQRENFLQENTKEISIKICSCREDCFCLQARRVTLWEDGQEIVLRDDSEKLKQSEYLKQQEFDAIVKRFKDSLNLEILLPKSKALFNLNKNEFLFYLNDRNEVIKVDGEEYYQSTPNGIIKIPLYELSNFELEDGIKKLYSQIDKNKVSSASILKQDHNLNVVFFVKKNSLSASWKDLIPVFRAKEKIVKEQIGPTAEIIPTYEDFQNFSSILEEAKKDPDFVVIENK